MLQCQKKKLIKQNGQGKIMKLYINVSKIYPEVIFYINWSKKSKNEKVKRRLFIKALKEFKCLSNEELRKRVKQNISF